MNKILLNIESRKSKLLKEENFEAEPVFQPVENNKPAEELTIFNQVLTMLEQGIAMLSDSTDAITGSDIANVSTPDEECFTFKKAFMSTYEGLGILGLLVGLRTYSNLIIGDTKPTAGSSWKSPAHLTTAIFNAVKDKIGKRNVGAKEIEKFINIAVPKTGKSAEKLGFKKWAAKQGKTLPRAAGQAFAWFAVITGGAAVIQATSEDWEWLSENPSVLLLINSLAAMNYVGDAIKYLGGLFAFPSIKDFDADEPCDWAPVVAATIMYASVMLVSRGNKVQQTLQQGFNPPLWKQEQFLQKQFAVGLKKSKPEEIARAMSNNFVKGTIEYQDKTMGAWMSAANKVYGQALGPENAAGVFKILEAYAKIVKARYNVKHGLETVEEAFARIKDSSVQKKSSNVSVVLDPQKQVSLDDIFNAIKGYFSTQGPTNKGAMSLEDILKDSEFRSTFLRFAKDYNRDLNKTTNQFAKNWSNAKTGGFKNYLTKTGLVAGKTYNALLKKLKNPTKSTEAPELGINNLNKAGKADKLTDDLVLIGLNNRDLAKQVEDVSRIIGKGGEKIKRGDVMADVPIPNVYSALNNNQPTSGVSWLKFLDNINNEIMKNFLQKNRFKNSGEELVENYVTLLLNLIRNKTPAKRELLYKRVAQHLLKKDVSFDPRSLPNGSTQKEEAINFFRKLFADAKDANRYETTYKAVNDSVVKTMSGKNSFTDWLKSKVPFAGDASTANKFATYLTVSIAAAAIWGYTKAEKIEVDGNNFYKGDDIPSKVVASVLNTFGSGKLHREIYDSLKGQVLKDSSMSQRRERVTVISQMLKYLVLLPDGVTMQQFLSSDVGKKSKRDNIVRKRFNLFQELINSPESFKGQNMGQTLFITIEADITDRLNNKDLGIKTGILGEVGMRLKAEPKARKGFLSAFIVPATNTIGVLLNEYVKNPPKTKSQRLAYLTKIFTPSQAREYAKGRAYFEIFKNLDEQDEKEPSGNLDIQRERPAGAFQQQNTTRENKSVDNEFLKKLVKETINETRGMGYNPYPYHSHIGEEAEEAADFVQDWKDFELSLVRDESRDTAVRLAKILVRDLELFGDVIDLVGKNQSVATEILKCMRKDEEKS